MNLLVKILNISSFQIELAVCAMVFLLPLRKKNWFRYRLAFSVLLLIIVGDIIYSLVSSIDKLPLPLAFFVAFFLCVLIFLITTESTLDDALFGATCAFAVQHMTYNIFSIVSLFFSFGRMTEDIVENIILLIVVVFCYVFCAKKITRNGAFQVKRSDVIRAFVIVLAFGFFISMIAEQYFLQSLEGSKPLYILCRVYATLCCIFVLWVQTSINERIAAEVELGTQKMLWVQQREQYELSRENIDLINRKCHDLKHQIKAIRDMSSDSQKDQYLREIEASVMIYDSVVKTGNKVLDTILTERSLHCEKEGIQWTCMADGRSLNFVDPIDLYTLLGNALDNAIEATTKVVDKEKKVISLNIFNKGQLVVIEMQNYYSNELQMVNGRPLTSKSDKDYHGIGIHSIEYTAQKYHGTISITTENEIFSLCILIPIPD